MLINQMLKPFLVVLLASQFSGTVVLAQGDQTLPSFCPVEVDEVAYNQTDDAEERVIIKICQWLSMDIEGRAINARANQQGDGKLFIGTALSEYSPDLEMGKWAASRPLVHTDAYLDLATEFAIQENGQNIQSEVEKRGFFQRGLNPQDLLCYPDETETGWYDRLLKKGAIVIEGKLDKALTELNIDPSNFEGSPKRKLARRVGEFVSALGKSTERDNLPTRVSGLAVIKTFEEIDGPEAAIGILARWSDTVNTMTRLMSSNNGNLPEDYPRGSPGKKVGQWINEIKKDLSHTFGVRIMRDENGYPLLLAFGHSSNRYFGPDRKKKKHDKQASLDLSEEEAYSQLAEYVAGNVQFSKTTNKEIRRFDGYELFDEQGRCIVQETQRDSFKESITQTWRSRARLDNFKGFTRKYKGTVKHPTVKDVQIAVSVVAWSPAISAPAPVVEKKVIKVKEKASGSLSSPVLGDLNDF